MVNLYGMNKVLIIGCAKSGYWASKLLNKKGYEVIITDAKEIIEKDELEKLGIKVYDNGHPDFLLDLDYEFVVKNPGIPYTNKLVKYFVDKKVKVYTEVETALNYPNNYKIAAITGTNGKTTITTLVYEILKNEFKAYACGNIGTAVSEIVYNHEDEEAKLSLEISAFQLLGSPSFHPECAVITNLTPDHLDYFDTLDDYYRAKTLVYKNMSEDDWFILNLDDEECVKYCKDIKCKVVTISLEKSADLCLRGDEVVLFDTVLFNKNDLKIIGKHNLFNAMVAACLAYKLGCSVDNIRNAIANFKGVEHRIEFVRELDGVKYYNDSKGTNTDSTVIALKAFDKPVILLAGGHDKHTGFKGIEDNKDKIKKLITFGETKDMLAKIKDDAIVCETMAEALNKAHEIADDGDVVLLSPACSSYDQFKNFEQRGKIFKELVNNL